MTRDTIRWPEKYDPKLSAVHVVNSLQMRANSQAVWHHLIHAAAWPQWYSNCSNVVLLGPSGSTLELGEQFRWKTFGMTITCTIEEFEPQRRLAWSAESFGMSVYHAWLISPRKSGCHVVTEETQNGLIPRIGKLVAPNKMHDAHQMWLERLDEIAIQGN
ncbi:SRPBCC family protein [Ruegeria jejuensis]|uniref:SRPBCC family protein n=1 Tax=Ruegeria jejuensis TaxID=3233338 RepID=UPI00355C65ED